MLQPSLYACHVKGLVEHGFADCLISERQYLRTAGIDFGSMVGYAYKTFTVHPHERLQGVIMEWTAPAFEEVCLNCEINSYASAKL
jgi:coenzyme PQQ precursor peptide PqqA